MKMNTLKNTINLLSILFLIITTAHALRPYLFAVGHQSKSTHKGGAGGIKNGGGHEEGGVLGMELYPTGSSLPDCSHACGPCTPCHRVIVSFNTCAVESCPIIYRCMCKGKYYHVPSN